MRPYVSLHNHTTASIGDSLITPSELLSVTKELGQQAVAVTDHGTLAGLWDSLKASKKTDVKLIAGCECYFSLKQDESILFNHLVLLAKNATGYKNLLLINKLAYDNFTSAFKRAIPRVTMELLEKYSEGLICTSACGNGPIGQCIMNDQFDDAKSLAKKFKDVFGDNFTLELQPHNLQRRSSIYSGAINQQKINQALQKISSDLDIRCIVATDAHYVKQEHHKAHDVYLCIATGQPISSGNRIRYDKHDFYIKDSEEVYAHFSRHKQLWGEKFIDSLFENTIYYADQCEKATWIDPAVSTGDKSQLPEFPYKDEPDYLNFQNWQVKNHATDAKLSEIPEDAQFYRYRSEIGLIDKVHEGKIPQADVEECVTSMLEEYDVLEYRGFSSYMLLTADFLNWCRKNKIPIGPGRGSVGGSLTAYLNGIHQAYPKRYGLIFARFLNKYKEAFPDIDNDISPSGRDKLHGYLRAKYGEESVAHVSNINTITPKVYARDISRVFEFGIDRSASAEIGDRIADSIPSDIHTVTQALTDAPLFAEYAKQYPQLAEFSELICGKPRAWSTHAGGIVISKRPLAGLVPLRRDISGALVLEYDKERAEENGLVKIDTLGLETLDTIGLTNTLIQETTGNVLDDFDYEISDDKSYQLVSEGNTFGVFQLGSTAVHVCKKVQPKNVADLALISSLVRPASKDIIPNLLKVRNGDEEMTLLHPSLYRAFANTYGFGLFEESLMYLAQDVAGWDLHDADKLRKLTKEKGKNPKKVEQWKQEFIEGAVKNKGIDKEQAEEIWNSSVAVFSGYGFNKSHATLYSMISFQTAWLKAHYPLQFLVANLMSEVKSNAKDAKDNINKIKAEIRALGTKIVPPDINSSDVSYKIVDDKTLMTGLDSLKYMGSDAIPELLSKRPFTSFQDLIYRTESNTVRSTSIQALAASGSLDSFGLPRHLMYLYASDYRAKLRAHMNKLDRKWWKELHKQGWQGEIDSGDFGTFYIDPAGNRTGSYPDPPKEMVDAHLAEFKYPFPEDAPWTISETFAMEEFFMGEGISGNTFDRYPGFFDKKKTVPFEALPKIFPYKEYSDDDRENRKANTKHIDSANIRSIDGVLINVFSFVVKKEDSKIFGQEMARLLLRDPWGTEISMVCFPEAWEGMKNRIEKQLSGGKQKIEPGVAIKCLALFQWETESTYSLILDDILSYKAPPSLPVERKSKKVKMPRTTKVSIKDIEDSSKEELVEKLEEEVLEIGMSPIDDDNDDLW